LIIILIFFQTVIKVLHIFQWLVG